MNQVENLAVSGLSEELGHPTGERLCARLGGGTTQISRTLSLNKCKKFLDDGAGDWGR